MTYDYAPASLLQSSELHLLLQLQINVRPPSPLNTQLTRANELHTAETDAKLASGHAAPQCAVRGLASTPLERKRAVRSASPGVDLSRLLYVMQPQVAQLPPKTPGPAPVVTLAPREDLHAFVAALGLLQVQPMLQLGEARGEVMASPTGSSSAQERMLAQGAGLAALTAVARNEASVGGGGPRRPLHDGNHLYRQSGDSALPESAAHVQLTSAPKPVVQMQDILLRADVPTPGQSVPSDLAQTFQAKAVVVSGGLRGLGQLAAEALAAGACAPPLVLTGRQGRLSGTVHLAASNLIHVQMADAACAADAETEYPFPVACIMHAAGELSDARLAALRPGSSRPVIGAKRRGTR